MNQYNITIKNVYQFVGSALSKGTQSVQVNLKLDWLHKCLKKKNLHEVPKDSPTCGKDTLRVTLAIIATNKWELGSIDIKTTFLQGNKLSTHVYLKPPGKLSN